MLLPFTISYLWLVCVLPKYMLEKLFIPQDLYEFKKQLGFYKFIKNLWQCFPKFSYFLEFYNPILGSLQKI